MNGTARVIAMGLALMLGGVVAWAGTDAIGRFNSHAGMPGHLGTIAILERIEKRIDRIEQKLGDIFHAAHEK